MNFFRNMTVDGALALFRKAVAHLEAVVEHHTHLQELHDRVIEDALKARNASADEIAKARAALANLKSFLND